MSELGIVKISAGEGGSYLLNHPNLFSHYLRQKHRKYIFVIFFFFLLTMSKIIVSWNIFQIPNISSEVNFFKLSTANWP